MNSRGRGKQCVLFRDCAEVGLPAEQEWKHKCQRYLKQRASLRATIKSRK